MCQAVRGAAPTLVHCRTQALLPLTWQEANLAQALLNVSHPQTLADYTRRMIQRLWLEILAELSQAQSATLDYSLIADKLAWRIGRTETDSSGEVADSAIIPVPFNPPLDLSLIHPLLQEVPLFTPLLGEERLVVQQFLDRLRQTNWLQIVEVPARSPLHQSSNLLQQQDSLTVGSQSPATREVTPTPVAHSLSSSSSLTTSLKAKGISQQPSRGVLYCAVSDVRYLEAALISAIALRQLEPTLPITLLTDLSHLHQLKLEAFNITVKHLEIPDHWRYPRALESRLIKTSLPAFTDYDQTLYLDADMLPLQPIAPIWDYLKHATVGLVVDRTPTIGQCDHIAQPEKDYTLACCPGTSPQFNGGMMLWESSPTALALFSAWKQEWLRFKQQDQLALIRAIQATQAEVIQIPNGYNFPLSQLQPEIVQQNQVRLLHCIGGLIPRGQYQKVAQKLLPDVVEIVQVLLQSFR